MAMPRFFVIQAGYASNPYLHLVPNPPSNMPWGWLKADESDIHSPRVKFEAEPSKTGTKDEVHIRCCYNNKYWVVHTPWLWVTAKADKPEEDPTDPSCTLFRADYASGQVRFFCIGWSTYVSHIAGVYGGFILANPKLIPIASTFSMIDWELLVKLPRQISFRSEDLGGQYLVSRVLDRWYNYQRFEAGMDIGDPLVAHEAFPILNGHYRIRNMHFGKFWRRSPNWIWADAEENNNSDDTKFEFIKTDNRILLVRNLGNNRFCGPLTADRKSDCLNAQYETVRPITFLMVDERVLQREITNIRYRLSETRIYQTSVVNTTESLAINSLPNVALHNLSFTKRDSRTTYWSNSLSLNYNVVANLKVTLIPVIAEGEVTTTFDASYEYKWSEELTTVEETQVTYTVPVPPHSSVRVVLMCTVGSVDVPYSYTQRDLLPDGRWVNIEKDDGLYTGTNTYSFKFESFLVSDRMIQEE